MDDIQVLEDIHAPRNRVFPEGHSPQSLAIILHNPESRSRAVSTLTRSSKEHVNMVKTRGHRKHI